MILSYSILVYLVLIYIYYISYIYMYICVYILYIYKYMHGFAAESGHIDIIIFVYIIYAYNHFKVSHLISHKQFECHQMRDRSWWAKPKLRNEWRYAEILLSRRIWSWAHVSMFESVPRRRCRQRLKSINMRRQPPSDAIRARGATAADVDPTSSRYWMLKCAAVSWTLSTMRVMTCFKANAQQASGSFSRLM